MWLTVGIGIITILLIIFGLIVWKEKAKILQDAKDAEVFANKAKEIAEEELPKMVKEILSLDQEIKILVKQFSQTEDMAILGEKLHFPIALEAALKLKETCYIKAEGFAAGEFTHGPLAIIKRGYPCLCFAPTDSVYLDNIDVMKKIKYAGGKITAITTAGGKMADKIAHITINIPKTLEMLTPILSIIPLQLLAYHIAIAKRIKVDKPRNIGKVVK